MITFSLSKGKVILCNDGVYFPLELEEVAQVEELLEDLQVTGTDSIYYRKDSRKKQTKELGTLVTSGTAREAHKIVLDTLEKRSS